MRHRACPPRRFQTITKLRIRGNQEVTFHSLSVTTFCITVAPKAQKQSRTHHELAARTMPTSSNSDSFLIPKTEAREVYGAAHS
jgi:hypothetical protein